jgi:hypothetical protein
MKKRKFVGVLSIDQLIMTKCKLCPKRFSTLGNHFCGVTSRSQCYKTFYIRNLLMLVIS